MPTASDCIAYGRALDEEFRRIQQEYYSRVVETFTQQISAYQELDRVTSARVHQRRWSVDHTNPWADDVEPASPKRKKVSNLSVLAEAERKLKECI